MTNREHVTTHRPPFFFFLFFFSLLALNLKNSLELAGLPRVGANFVARTARKTWQRTRRSVSSTGSYNVRVGDGFETDFQT